MRKPIEVTAHISAYGVRTLLDMTDDEFDALTTQQKDMACSKYIKYVLRSPTHPHYDYVLSTLCIEIE